MKKRNTYYTTSHSQDSCIYKTRPRLDLTTHPLDKNNPSLSSLPSHFQYSSSVKYQKAWSFFRFLGRDLRGKFKTYILCVQFNFTPDSRGLLRAYRKNGWLRGKAINLYHLDGSPLPIDEEKKNRTILVQRLKYFLSRNTLDSVVIFRYQLTLMCYNLYGFKMPTDSRGWVFDTHHKNGLSLILSGDLIHCSTLEFKDNLILMNRIDHRLVHFKYGDTHFVNFDSSHLTLFQFHFFTYLSPVKLVI
jgi:hypothetical protein